MKDERENRLTDGVYERDSYVKDFSAKVLACQAVTEKNLYATILDLTAFFPEGGGQPSDTGQINGIEVVDVQNEAGNIVHYMTGPVENGALVTGSIDFDKRYSRMQNHSAEHLLCGLIHNAYGYDNVGFHLNDEYTTFDINGVLSEEQLNEVLLKANQVIYENVPIKVSFPESEEIEKLQYRSKLEMTENVRLVTIEGYDICACCAPHVKSTGEIGIIQIIQAVLHRGGMRITLLAGKRAYDDYMKLDSATRDIMNIVSSKRYETAAFVAGLDERYNKLLQENTRLKKRITELTLKEIRDNIDKRPEDSKDAFLIFSEELDDIQLRNMINECKERINGIVAGFIGSDGNGYRYVIAVNETYAEGMAVKLNQMAKEISVALNGRGGGSALMIQGQVLATKKDIEKYFANIND